MTSTVDRCLLWHLLKYGLDKIDADGSSQVRMSTDKRLL